MPGKVLLLETLGADYGGFFLARGFVRLVGSENVRMWPFKRTHVYADVRKTAGQQPDYDNQALAIEASLDHYPERVWEGKVLRVKGDGTVGYGDYTTGSELWAHRAFWRFWKPEKNVAPAKLANDMATQFMEPIAIPEASDDEIFAMVRRGEFSLIVLNGSRWHGSAALHELKETFGSSLPPVAFCDHDDYPQRRWDFYDAFQPAVCFKRTMIVGGHPHDNILGHRDGAVVKPLPFSIMWDIPWVPWNEREIDVFCVLGNTQVMRGKLREAAAEVAAKFPGLRVRAEGGHPMGHPAYMQMLAKSKIVVDHQGFGSDTLRFWEAAASGACLISDLSLEMPPPGLGDRFVRYPNDLSANTDQQDFVRFRELLAERIRDDANTEKWARALYDHVRAHHKNEDRARFVVAEVRARGHRLEGLP